MTSLLPQGEQQFFDASGNVLANGTVTFYTPGTTTLKNTWADPNSQTLNTNPVVLDAGGRAVIYGEGQYTMVLADQYGNQIYSQTTASADYGVSLTGLGVSSAMLPVVQASTTSTAAGLLLSNISHLNIPAGDQLLTVAPTANTIPTLASLNVQGNTASANGRDFLVNFGLTSGIGSGGTAGNDKVTLYAGLQANAGTSDVWTINSCLTMGPSSGNYTAQGYELDFNNNNQALGNGALGDLGSYSAYGLSISGASEYSSTAGILITGATGQWNRGILFANEAFVQDCIEDISTSPCTLRIAGTKQYGINMTDTAFTGAAMFLPNGAFSSLTWQSADTTQVISDYVDSSNNRCVGIGSNNSTNQVILGSTTIPETPNVYNLGSTANQWAILYTNDIHMINGGELQWENAAGNGNVFDYVDPNNARIIGVNASVVYSNTSFAPKSTGLNLGSTTNLWQTLYLTGQIVGTSDIRLKEDVHKLPSLVNLLHEIDPISYRWKDLDQDQRVHLGFSAQQVKKAFDKVGENLAVHEVANDSEQTQMISKDEMFPVLWRVVQELSEEVTRLKRLFN